METLTLTAPAPADTIPVWVVAVLHLTPAGEVDSCDWEWFPTADAAHTHYGDELRHTAGEQVRIRMVEVEVPAGDGWAISGWLGDHADLFEQQLPALHQHTTRD